MSPTPLVNIFCTLLIFASFVQATKFGECMQAPSMKCYFRVFFFYSFVCSFYKGPKLCQTLDTSCHDYPCFPSWILTTPEDHCIKKAVDTLFILDASGSVGPDNFEKEKQFAINIVNGLDIGPGPTDSR